MTRAVAMREMAGAINAAKLISKRAHNVPGKIRITEYFFEVPHDWNNPTTSRPLTIFARGARRLETPADPSGDEPKKDLPWLLFLQGGPGFESPGPQNAYWIQTILDKGYQVLCLDQRGTGLSSPLTQSTLQLRGDDKLQAQYLRAFRADSIVKDCEAIRKTLMRGQPPEKAKWTIMAQSFGGFCATTYLSFFPSSLREVFMFGGLPPLVNEPDEVYRRLIRVVVRRNEAYYQKYPEDIERVQQICKFLQRFGDTTVRDTTSQGFLTARRFLQMGLCSGAQGGIDTIHDVVLRAHSDLNFVGHLTRPTVSRIESLLPWNNHILYAVLHEAIYCQGEASNWSCQRIVDSDFAEKFHIPTPSEMNESNKDKPIYFTGEMIFPHMFEDYYELQKIKNPAEMIAQYKDWPQLYDEKQLAENEVPVYCAVYMEDMYVGYEFSVEAASRIKGTKIFISNMMYHDAIRSRMDEVVRNVWALRDDPID